MRTVWKVEIEAWTSEISLVADAVPLCVQMQNDTPCIWFEVDSEQRSVDIPVIVVGTGHPIPEGNWKYVGTFQIPTDNLVFHIYLGEAE
jgi:hypothetical protein